MATKSFGRLTNKEKIDLKIYDTEQTHSYDPMDYTGNKYFGTWSKMVNMQ